MTTIRWLMIALLGWGLLLAVGAMMFGYRTDLRKPIIVGACVLTFVGAWAGLLAYRHQQRHGSGDPSAEPDQTRP